MRARSLLLLCGLANCVRAGFTAGSGADGALADRPAGQAEGARERWGERPACAAIALAEVTLNTGSKLVLSPPGKPPFLYALVSGEGEVDADGTYWAPGHPTRASIRITDSVGCSLSAPVTVGGSTLWLLGGRDSAGKTLDTIYRSGDGRAWTLAGHLPGPRCFGSAAVFDGRLWYLGGSDAAETQSYAEVWASKDGKSFVQQGSFPVARYAGGATFHRRRLWIAGGLGDSSAAWTADGATWTTASKLAVPVHSTNLLAFKDRLWIPGGHGGSFYADVWSSADGAAWSVSGALPSGRECTAAGVFAGKLWVAGGRHTAVIDEVVSGDGAQWIVAGHLPGPSDHGSLVEWNGRLWYAGAGTQVLSSADGASWVVEATIASVDSARLAAFTPSETN